MKKVYDENLFIIGVQVKKLRKRKDYTQEGLAAALGISPMTLSRIENGTIAMNNQILLKMSEILEVSAEEILCIKKSEDEEK